MCFDPVSKDVCGLPHGAMQEQLRAPCEVVLLARIESNGSLVLLNCAKWVPELLVEFSGHAMEIGIVLPLQEFVDVLASLFEIAGLFIRQGEVAFVVLVRGIEPVCGLE